MIRFLKRPTSEQVAEKMLKSVEGFDAKLRDKPNKTAAEKRHLLRLRTSAVLSRDQVTIKRKIA